MLNLPCHSRLQAASRVLIAGAGGGYDVFCGLPLYFGLRDDGKDVHLANLSFSTLNSLPGRRPAPSVVEVNADSPGFSDYFPEKFLSLWFREREGREVPIHCFELGGVRPLLAGYQALVAELSIDTVILVDGGTDSLMQGDEDGLGTPEEDMASLAAVDRLAVGSKMLVCLGFGVDHYHGVSNDHSFAAVADLTRRQGFLGMFSLHREMPEVGRYREATEFAFRCMPERCHSLVSGMILSALDGRYGDHHTNPRTRGSRLWINPLMPLYLFFDLRTVAERVGYLEALMETQTRSEVVAAISAYRQKHEYRLRTRRRLPD